MGILTSELDHEVDSKYRQVSHTKSREIVNELIDELDLVDIWHVRNPDTFDFTWKKLNPNRMFSRLDWFLVNTGHSICVDTCNITSVLQTDHRCITLSIKMNEYQRGPGIWKLNNLHLSDVNFKSEVHHIFNWAKQVASTLPTIDVKWEFIKSQIIEYCQNYSVNVA